MTRAFLYAFALFLASATAQASEPVPWAFGFQAAASPTMARIAELATLLNVVIIAIVALVTALLGWCMWRYHEKRNPVPATWTHNTKLEIAWTAIPTLILFLIAFPSLKLLYFMDRTQTAEMTLKVTGHQWYWSYDYPDHNLKFDALMTQDSDLQPGQLRLLTTDNPVVLPVGVAIRVQLTADDVIHSWAVPALGLKTDTVPGRLNETWVRIDRPGTYYGQCSELCGVNHGFMPIMIHAVPKEQFTAWLDEARTRFAARPSQVALSGESAR
ncbi:cytochrome c oxidase subunit II [Magnetospirillum moscoviense]|uniref:Cytochrome c oxidase subunit 2 n=1 Tax=Magnetospirillum moscoviense TaxID=1437059 RepID=A0A178MXN9_9PROT|nr:cytochrome c oxidase subunit II [Magnetospirillum moscoviense]OAN55705.1 cytochrome C oxidase subunit II [Magnetospirillum moscoviense]